MHQVLVAAAFLTLILAPCLTAINTGNDDFAGFEEEEESC